MVEVSQGTYLHGSLWEAPPNERNQRAEELEEAEGARVSVRERVGIESKLWCCVVQTTDL